MTRLVSVAAVLADLSAGASLVRVTSSKLGARWHVAPSNLEVTPAVGEAVAEHADVCCLDGPVGRMVWVYVAAGRREEAEAARKAAMAIRTERSVDPLSEGGAGCGDPNCACATPAEPYLGSIRTRRSTRKAKVG